MAGFESWASYFYPETVTESGYGTLRNKLGERDADVLRAFEYSRTAIRESELLDGTARVERTYGADHLRAIHRYLFQDVYEWAGEYRSVNMSKPGEALPFANAKDGEIAEILGEVQRFSGAVDWAGLDGDRFITSSAAVFSYVNQAHPFREGNGRAGEVFMEHLAEQSSFTFDFSRVDRQAWNEASEASRPTVERPEANPAALLPVFVLVTEDRTVRREPASWAEQEHHRLMRANFPKPASEATRRGSGQSGEVPRRSRGYGPGLHGHGQVRGDDGRGMGR